MWKEDNVIVNQKYIFLPPINTENSFCLECYKLRMKELDLYEEYFGGEVGELNFYELQLISELIKKLNSHSSEKFLYEINRGTMEIRAKSTFKRGDCICGEYIREKQKKPSEMDTEFGKNQTRQRPFSEVIEAIEKNRKMIYASEASIINAVSRSGDSYGTPMVQTEVLHKNVSMYSYGRTSTYSETKYISILESLERYATAFPHRKKKKKFYEGEIEAIDLTLSEVMEMSDYSNMSNYSKDVPLYYEPVQSLHKRCEVLIPEQLVYYNAHTVSDEKRFIYESSNGSAIGSTEDEASLHAMLELIERDAFLATWYGRIPPVRIEVQTLCSKRIKAYIHSLERKRIKVHIFEISMEIKIPTIWVLLEKIEPKDNEMAFYTAASADFDLEEAIERALIEATTAISVFTHVFDRPDYLKRKKELIKKPKEVSRLEDHLLLYSNRETKKLLEFALSTQEVNSIANLENTYTNYQGTFASVVRKIEEQLADISQKAYKAVTYNPNLFRASLINVKYIVPGMLTMTFGHQNKRVVKARVMGAIDYKKKGEFDESWIQEIPHPFP